MKEIKINIRTPTISDIDMMYEMIILKNKSLINNYDLAVIKINEEFDVNITSRDLQAALDVNIDTEIEDLQLIYNNL